MTPKQLQKLRAKLGITQRELAGAIVVHPNTVSKWERGDRRISSSVEKLIRLVSEIYEELPEDDANHKPAQKPAHDEMPTK